jgi:3'(2'), 5'-bisphosphate nucleotidase
MFDMKELLEKAVKAAILGGKEILEVYAGEFTVEEKDDKSPLTMADKRAHQAILDILENTGIPILSEEGKNISYATRSLWKKFWLVDPLDGTKEFIKRNGEFTVNIGLIESGRPVMGVIYVPVTKVLYFGSEELGARKTETQDFNSGLDELIRQSVKIPGPHNRTNYTVVCSRSHMSDETKEYVDKLKEQHGELDFASRGSSLKLCMIAEGGADIYPRFAPTMEWDTAAGQAIVECAGGVVTMTDEQTPLSYNKENLLNPWFIAKLKD